MAEGGGSSELYFDDSTSPLSSSPSASNTEDSSRDSPSLSRSALDELGHENENLDDPENYPLHSAWMLWFDRTRHNFTAQAYFDNLKKVCSIKTIKAFWCAFNYTPVDQLNIRESYHLMRGEKRRPIWEDVDNADGGLWFFRIRKDDTALVWQELLLAAIGEQFSEHVAEGDDVCGVSVRIRGYDHNVIQIWNQDSELQKEATVMERVKELLPNMDIQANYQSNRNKMQESLMKNPQPQSRGFPPQHRYSGAPPLLHAPMFPHPPHHAFPGQPGPRMFPPPFRHPTPSQHYHQIPHPPHPNYQGHPRT